MAFGALGTDTGGSCRIPAALCGIVGFKPTAQRVPTAGAFPLSASLDSIGPLAATVGCCAVLDAVLAGEPSAELPLFPLEGLRHGGAADHGARRRRAGGGAAHSRPPWPRCARPARASSIFRCASSPSCREINAKGGLSAAESYAIHRALIAKSEKSCTTRACWCASCAAREQDAADYIDLVNARADFIRRVAAVTAPYDALVMPTTPLIAPRIADLAADDAYRHANMLVLRNPSIANFLDRCSISIPCHRAGDAPVGLMLIGEHGADRRLLSIAAAIEKVVSPDGA